MYLTQGLHRSLQQTPERIATIFRGRRRTFRELGDRVARLAAALCAAGMARGDRVGILALNSDRYLEDAMGVWWGGGVLNPVNTRWSVPEIAYSLDDCDTRILIVDDHFLDVVSGICSAVRIPPVLDSCRRRRCARGHAVLRNADRGYGADAGRGTWRQRPRVHHVHRRHHRVPEGRDAHAT